LYILANLARASHRWCQLSSNVRPHMNSRAARASLVDASALVKLHLPEPGFEKLRAFWNEEPLKYTTQFCFYEALSLLKGVWKGRRAGVTLTQDEYMAACSKLFSWYGAMARRIPDLDFTSVEVFLSARRIAVSRSLDLSDAFQILSVKQGYFSASVGDYQTLFVTADGELASAAEAEGLRVWLCTTGDPPR
jgi:predicted nucleic acid-binding protein